MFNKSNTKHKLVVIGDSLSQGFMNGGIYRTDLSFPTFLSRCFEPEPDFTQPLFTAQGGIPLNLEILLRGLSDDYGETLRWNEYLPAFTHVYSTLRRIKRYWEGKMIPLSKNRSIPYYNQSVWGFSINDAWLVDARNSRKYIETEKIAYSIFDILPDHAMYITACMVLNPSFGEKFDKFNQIDNARYLQEHGGIEHLIVSMGHNNIIGAVTDLNFRYSEPSDLTAFPSNRQYTVYRPEHFRQEFRKLAEQVSKIGAQNIITQTIPYVTIPPVSRGVNEDRSRGEGGYFDYYTRFWIWDDVFDPGRHPHLTKEEAIKLDQTVDEYNHIIYETAKEYGWIVVPLNRYLSAVARRRLSQGLRIPYPDDFVRAMKQNPATAHLVEDKHFPRLSTEYLRIDEETGKVRKGGIFSLDGIHPTTIGYGLMAHVYYQTMEKYGIKFDKPLNWEQIIANDTLVTEPPYLLADLKKVLRFLSLGKRQKISRLGQGLLHQVMELFSPPSRGGPKQSPADVTGLKKE